MIFHDEIYLMVQGHEVRSPNAIVMGMNVGGKFEGVGEVRSKNDRFGRGIKLVGAICTFDGMDDENFISREWH